MQNFMSLVSEHIHSHSRDQQEDFVVREFVLKTLNGLKTTTKTGARRLVRLPFFLRQEWILCSSWPHAREAFSCHSVTNVWLCVVHVYKTIKLWKRSMRLCQYYCERIHRHCKTTFNAIILRFPVYTFVLSCRCHRLKKSAHIWMDGC